MVDNKKQNKMIPTTNFPKQRETTPEYLGTIRYRRRPHIKYSEILIPLRVIRERRLPHPCFQSSATSTINVKKDPGAQPRICVSCQFCASLRCIVLRMRLDESFVCACSVAWFGEGFELGCLASAFNDELVVSTQLFAEAACGPVDVGYEPMWLCVCSWVSSETTPCPGIRPRPSPEPPRRQAT